jgi:hypothetical protein
MVLVLANEKLTFGLRSAVFQVVFLHPDLWEDAKDNRDWRAAAGFVSDQR